MLTTITLILELIVKWFLKDIALNDSTKNIVDLGMILVLFIAFCADIAKSKKTKYAQIPLILGTLFRIALVIFDIFGRSIYVLPNSAGDSEMFYANAVEFVASHHTVRGAFPAVMGTLFSVIGTSRLYGQFLLAMCSVLSLCILAWLLNQINIDMRVKYTIMMITALLPNLAIISSLFLRESIVAMFISLSFFLFYKWTENGTHSCLVLSFVSAFLASRFHSGSIAIVMGYIAIILLYDRKASSFRFRAKNLISSLLLVFVVAFLYTNYSDTLFGKMSNVDSIEDIAKTTITGGSSYAQYVGNSSNPLSMALYTIPRIVYFLYSPFPWQWRGISDIIAFVFSSLFFLATTWSVYRYFKRGDKSNRTLVLTLVIVTMCAAFVFAWGTSNTGTAVRHRDKMTIIWALMLALTYRSTNSRKYSENNTMKI